MCSKKMTLIYSMIPNENVEDSPRASVKKDEGQIDHDYETLLLQVDDTHSKLSTSLLFQAALSAGHRGDTVVYIRKEAFSRLPYHINKMPAADPMVMNHLKFIYLSTADEVIGYLASFHTLPLYPDLLIIEDLSYYISIMQDSGREVSIARLSAAINDVMCFMKIKSTSGFRILTSTHESVPFNLKIYHRYFPHVCHLRGDISREGCQLQYTNGTAGELDLRLFLHRDVIHLSS